MMFNQITVVQYDGHAWTVEAGPNAMGYYRLARVGTDYPHTAHVHSKDIAFQPETTGVLAVIDAMYGVYLKRDGDAGDAEAATENALIVLGWARDRAYRAASYAASNHR
jgi:hypothetical protein